MAASSRLTLCLLSLMFEPDVYMTAYKTDVTKKGAPEGALPPVTAIPGTNTVATARHRVTTRIRRMQEVWPLRQLKRGPRTELCGIATHILE